MSAGVCGDAGETVADQAHACVSPSMIMAEPERRATPGASVDELSCGPARSRPARPASAHTPRVADRCLHRWYVLPRAGYYRCWTCPAVAERCPSRQIDPRTIEEARVERLWEARFERLNSMDALTPKGRHKNK